MNAFEFVTAAAHLGAGAPREPLAALDSPDLWPSVLKLAVDHRVAALVGEALSRSPHIVAPAEVRAVLDEQLLRSSATRLLCESSLASTVRILRTRGVEVIVLKGATVAHTMYPRPEFRIYHDLDVLCRAADYPALYEALMSEGYTSAGTHEARGTHETLATKPSRSESHQVRAFYDPSEDVKIEVHFDAMQLGLVDRLADEFWRGSRTIGIDGTDVRMLAPEHQFLHLAFHAHRHGYSRLSWLIELDACIRQTPPLDWSALLDMSRAEGIGTAIRHALATTHAVLGTPVPALAAPTLEERCLGLCYRALWPFGRVRRLTQLEHHRLLHFLPDSTDARNVIYGFVLLGRRREKLDALVRRRLPSALR